MPQLLGLDLQEAEEILRKQGIPWEVRITQPPREAPEGFWKVVKQTETEGGLLLTVCSVPDAYRENAGGSY